MRITLIDDSVRFDGLMPTTRPLNGAEKAFASLPAALAGLGHEVTVFNHCHADMTLDQVKWRTWSSTRPFETDVLIACRKPALLGAVRKAKHRVLWVTAEPSYLNGRSSQTYLDSHEPRVIFVSETQRRAWRGEATVIAPAVRPEFRRKTPLKPVSPPRAVVTTHPRHGLDWLLGLWRDGIRPACPEAELHVYSSALAKGMAGEPVEADLAPLVESAMGDIGVTVKKPDGDLYMADDYAQARVHLYPGHGNDMACWTLAETQSFGLPAVARPLGAAPERIKGGFIAQDDETFVKRTLEVLQDDGTFERLSAQARQGARSWSMAASEFLALWELR